MSSEREVGAMSLDQDSNNLKRTTTREVLMKCWSGTMAVGGRDGQATIQDGSLSIQLATPKELGGAGGPGNDPEQLFAAGYAACFVGAMKAVAPAQKLCVPTDATVTATIGVGPRAEGGYGLSLT
jgi:osmotically inducible protein OsmC